MTTPTRRLAGISFQAMLFNLVAIAVATAEPAPIPRLVVPMTEAPATVISMFADLDSVTRTIEIDGAQSLQLQFSEFQLGDSGELTIRSTNDHQTYTQEQLEAWEGLTAIFNGAEITITLTPGTSAEVGVVVVGLSGATPENGLEIAGPELNDVLGADLERFIPVGPPGVVMPAICGFSDDRVASNNRATGRIMPIGCTGWIIQDGRLLTAGHCIGSASLTVEFNVPASKANGTTVSPPVRHQYRVIASSIVHADTGVGNDWAVFEVLPNTETGLMPIEAQGSFFPVSNTATPSTVRITGFGLDGPAPDFGNHLPRNADNRTQQTHAGLLTQISGGANTGTLHYSVDTQGGNSGSPVIADDGTNRTIGIHTKAGCPGGTNAGTSFRNQALWNALHPM